MESNEEADHQTRGKDQEKTTHAPQNSHHPICLTSIASKVYFFSREQTSPLIVSPETCVNMIRVYKKGWNCPSFPHRRCKSMQGCVLACLPNRSVYENTGKTRGLDTTGVLIKGPQTMGREISRRGGLGHWRSATIPFSFAALCFLGPLAFPQHRQCNLCGWLDWVS